MGGHAAKRVEWLTKQRRMSVHHHTPLHPIPQVLSTDVSVPLVQLVDYTAQEVDGFATFVEVERHPVFHCSVSVKRSTVREEPSYLYCFCGCGPGLVACGIGSTKTTT